MHLAGHKLHFLASVMGVGLCKFPVGRTLVGSVSMSFLHRVPGHPLALGDVVLQEVAVSECRGLDMHPCDQAGLAFLPACLGYVCHIVLHRLLVLVAVGGVGIVGILEAVRRYFLHGPYADNPVLDRELFIEHALEKLAFRHCLKNGVYIFSQHLELRHHGIRIGAVDRLCRVLCKIAIIVIS